MSQKQLALPSGQQKPQNDEKPDWTQVLFEIIIKILTLGFYHIEKNRKQ